MTAGIVPITADERRARIANAQRLMGEQKIDAIFMEGTASSFYFADMRWGQSERTFGIVIPAKGDLACVCPKFEEDRARTHQVRHRSAHMGRGRESMQSDRRHREGPRRAASSIGMEERVRFFIADGVRKKPPASRLLMPRR